MINDIKSNLNNLRGKKIKISVDIGRNKNEIYEGYILNLYDNIWTFKTDIDTKSFGYNDILIKNVVFL